MATLTFDKLAYVDRLKAAGMGEREARALADGLDQALREEVATRTDLAAVKTELQVELQAVKHELQVELQTVKHELQVEIQMVRHDFQVELQTVKHDVLRWMVGVAFGQVGLTVALIRFLPH
ncbi:MAG: hypothetical protein GEV13_27535 [Rhodospirillales bacterium]|nr:hypothetical protein [Rhodospirillales bacterium]